MNKVYKIINNNCQGKNRLTQQILASRIGIPQKGKRQ